MKIKLLSNKMLEVEKFLKQFIQPIIFGEEIFEIYMIKVL